jgi:serine/threonine protein kinase
VIWAYSCVYYGSAPLTPVPLCNAVLPYRYAFQNTEFLVLVMDIVRSSDLSEFVLGKRRLTRAQVKWIIMEVMAVMRYLHSKGVLYRDLKVNPNPNPNPNLLLLYLPESPYVSSARREHPCP